MKQSLKVLSVDFGEHPADYSFDSECTHSTFTAFKYLNGCDFLLFSKSRFGMIWVSVKVFVTRFYAGWQSCCLSRLWPTAEPKAHVDHGENKYGK